MTYRRRGRGRRPAFTLIELLVVIAIIAILVSLTAAAVMQMLVKGPELKTNSELHELEQKLAGVKNLPGHDLDYLPSHLILRKQNGYNLGNPVEAETYAFLQRRFGRHACYDLKNLAGTNPPVFVDWNGDGNPNEVLDLQGQQVLVFLLGGIPTCNNGSIGMTGFAQNETNPAQPGGSREPIYFEFQPNRLRLPTSAPPYTLAPKNSFNPSAGVGTFPMYLDPWNATPVSGNQPWGPGMPYAFFATSNATGGGSYSSDCPLLGVAPYFTSVNNGVTQFVNPNTWQIVSAGRDGIFGPGGAWNPSQPAVPQAGQDDQANFSSHKLGIPAN